MKKILSLVAVMAVAVMMSSSVWADAITTKSAYATFTLDPLEFSVNLYNWETGKDYATEYTGTPEGSISFDLSTIKPGIANSRWAKANTFAKIHSNLTSQPASTKVYIYTKNTATEAGNYQAKASRSTTKNVYNGLVRKNMGDTYQAGDYAPLEMKNVKVSDANTNYKTSLPTEFALDGAIDQGERYLLDKEDSDWSTAGDEGQLIGKGGITGGIWVCKSRNEHDVTDNWYSGTEDVIVFFGARFESVIGGYEYGTTSITFNTAVE